MKRSGGTKAHRSRNIVDPKDWNRSEVSGVAEAKLHTQGSSKKCGGSDARVTSIRSSLFKRAAESAVVSSRSPSGGKVGGGGNDNEGIFKTEEEALEMDRSLTFTSNASLQMCEYGKNNKKVWVMDIFALLHNGLRFELGDLGINLQAMKNIREKATLSDFSDLRGWWHTFSGILTDYLVLEEKVLIPWMEKAVSSSKKPDMEGSAFVRNSMSRRQEIRTLIMDITKTFGALCNALPPALREKQPPRSTSAGQVMKNLDKLIGVVANYVWEEEVKLSGFLSEHYSSEKKERDDILGKVFTHMTSQLAQRKDEFFVLQTRWMSDPKAVKQHTKLISSHHEVSMSKIQTQFELSHAGVVAVFRVKGNLE